MKPPAFIKVAIREIRQIVTGHSTRLILFYIPVVVFPILALIYHQGSLREIPVAIWDQDHSDMSRLFTEYVNASPTLKITDYLSASDNLQNYFFNHKERAIFHIPKGFEHDILGNKNTHIQIFTNSSNIIFGNIMMREAYKVTGALNKKILMKKFVKGGLTPKRAEALTTPIRIHTKSLFNPNYNYLYYLVPGLLTVLLQMIVFFVAARAFNSEVKHGSFNQLMETSHNSALNMLVGKSIAYLLMGLYVTGLIVLIFWIFGIPFQQKEGQLLLLFSYFILVNIFLGFMISTTITDEILSLDVAFLYNSPAFIFSGFTFPVFAMTFFSSTIAQFIPYTHFLHAFFKLYQLNAPFVYTLPDFYKLTLFLVVGFITSFIALHIRMKSIISTQKNSLQHVQ